MQVTAYQSPLVRVGDDIYHVLSQTLAEIPENSVVAITSKIIALCEGRVVKRSALSKEELVREEAEWFTDPEDSPYHMMLAIKNNQLFINAGIDESNADGKYVLWPTDPQRYANEIWGWIRSNFGIEQVGVIITDSKTVPMHWGVTGAAIAHCGFRELNSKIGQADLFGRELHATQVNVSQALAAAAVFEMGEAAEQTPVAIIAAINDIEFQDRPPTSEELAALKIEPETDIYLPILAKANWKKGGG